MRLVLHCTADTDTCIITAGKIYELWHNTQQVSVQAYQCVKKNNYRCNFGKFTAYDRACGCCFQASKKLSEQFKKAF